MAASVQDYLSHQTKALLQHTMEILIPLKEPNITFEERVARLEAARDHGRAFLKAMDHELAEAKRHGLPVTDIVEEQAALYRFILGTIHPNMERFQETVAELQKVVAEIDEATAAAKEEEKWQKQK